MITRYDKKGLHLTRRFAAMAGVARRTIKRELHRYYLVASVLRPATAASRWDVIGKFGDNPLPTEKPKAKKVEEKFKR
jgi:hypothetical protein